MKEKLEMLILKLPSYSEELGLDLNKPEDVFKWFLASMLFAKRISTKIAKKTFERFMEDGLTTPESILAAGWDRLVEILDSGGYVRYDFSTATNILEAIKLLKDRYEGSLEELHEEAKDSVDLEKRLMEFKGIGPIATNIFLRELRNVWYKAKPKPSSLALKTAKRLGIKDEDIKTYESQLVRLTLEYCRKQGCKECFVRSYCKKSLRQD
ncbi:MAG: hypothetical protein QW265_00340 [Candidatus Bathyarchaeia archaeon]